MALGVGMGYFVPSFPDYMDQYNSGTTNIPHSNWFNTHDVSSLGKS